MRELMLSGVTAITGWRALAVFRPVFGFVVQEPRCLMFAII